MLSNFIDRLLSRKFFIFIIGTIFLYLKIIDTTTWLYLCGLYLGIEGIADIVTRFKHGWNNTNTNVNNYNNSCNCYKYEENQE